MLKNYRIEKIHLQNSKINVKSVFLNLVVEIDIEIWTEKKLMHPKRNMMLLL
jgi:hypothetical protein